MSAIKIRAIQRGRLLERIAQQRAVMAIELAPVADLLNTADHVVEGTEKIRHWIGENPIIIGIGLLALLIWRPKGALKLVKNGTVGWRVFRLIRRLFA